MESCLVQALVRWAQKITGLAFPEPLAAPDYATCFRSLLL